ncbi:hypothetical protein IC617_08665 [Neiella sp. HB171785]|uniref:Uncharacterized protein n=1 Tax=Neiella litorisoli TaxID=2771431 RepID=A0A8J6QIR5_9GAMM|nr:hypothetical protein [Neiella litorisoli]MBD1389498.1 hypothetical protein [Neiella litorisoli]
MLATNTFVLSFPWFAVLSAVGVLVTEMFTYLLLYPFEHNNSAPSAGDAPKQIDSSDLTDNQYLRRYVRCGYISIIIILFTISYVL